MKAFKKPFRFIACFLIVLILMLGTTGCSAPLKKFEATRTMMDTFITFIVYTTDEARAEEVMNAAFDRMEEIESVASIYDEQSQAFQLNQDGYLESPSKDLSNLIELSLRYSQQTDGYFDITVQPLLELWESGLWMEPEDVQQNRVNETLRLIGPDKIEVEDDRILFTEEGVEITPETKAEKIPFNREHPPLVQAKQELERAVTIEERLIIIETYLGLR